MNLEARDDTVRLTESIYLIYGPNQAKFPFCNGFLIDGKAVILIDAGIGEKKIREIDALKRIDILIISHSHPDHLLHWHTLRDRRVFLPKETPESVNNLLEMGMRFTGTEEKGYYWAKRVGKGLGLMPIDIRCERFGDRSIFKAGKPRLEAIHAPGHLNDHYCFFERESGLLLTTDIDFSSFGPWYGNSESDIEEFKKSVKKVMALPYKLLCSSHKPPIYENGDKCFKSYLHAFARQKNIVLSLCHPPITLNQMVALSPFYKNRMPDKIIQKIFEEPMIKKNLALLLKEGRVREKFGKYQRED